MTLTGGQVDATTPRIGYVIIGRNEGKRLIRCLDSLTTQRSAEIVYVDSGSTDQSVAEATKRGAHVVPLDLDRPFTAGRARNEGFAALVSRAPETEFVQFIDGDCELALNWTEFAAVFLNAHADVATVCGRRRERYPQASIYNQLCDIEWNTPVGEAESTGGDALVRAAPFAEIGGFASHLIAHEEPEMCARLRAKGWKIWRIDNEMTLHDAAIFKFRQWWLRGVRAGFGYAQVWTVTRASPIPLCRSLLLRDLLWGGVFPAIFGAVTLVFPIAALVMLGIYGMQVARIAARRGITHFDSWAYGFFAMLAKFCELQGALKYFMRARKAGASEAIFYK